jgi:hypothetical protein
MNSIALQREQEGMHRVLQQHDASVVAAKNVTRMCSTYRTLMKKQLGVYGSCFNHHLSTPSSG